MPDSQQPDRPETDRKQQMAAATTACDVLAAQFLNNPAVSLIDIGLGAQAPGSGLQPLVLRLHVKSEAAKQNIHAPDEVNGFPVRVMVADYRLE